jgi:glutathione S-transferase
MKLYYFETPNGRKPCAVAKHLSVRVEYVRVDLSKGQQRQPDFLATNPNGKIPALEDGDVKLWEAHAIMCYLAYKAGSDLWPKSDLEKIDLIRWLNWDTAHFSRHAGRLFFERVIKPHFGIGEPNPTEIQDATGYFKQFAAVLNEHLKGRKYILGSHLTVADFALGAFLPHAKEAQMPLDDCGEIRRWHDSLMELPAWRQPFPG